MKRHKHFYALESKSDNFMAYILITLAYFKKNKFMVIVMNNCTSSIIIKDGNNRIFLKRAYKKVTIFK